MKLKVKVALCAILFLFSGIVTISILFNGESPEYDGKTRPLPNPPVKVEIPLDEKQQIVQQLNTLTWILAQVKYHNDIKAIDDADELLKSDYLNFKILRDRRLIEAVNRIRNFITSIRINEGDRALADAVFEHESSQCLWDAFSGVSCGNSINPMSALLNLTTSAAGGYMQYRKALASKQLEHRKRKWELDKEQIREVNDLENDLNEIISDLTQRYSFPDNWRIGSNDAKWLVETLKWGAKQKAHHELCLEENNTKYVYFPQYWLHLGVLEFALYRETNDKAYLQKAQESLDCYLNRYSNIHRNSDDVVLAASTMIGIKSEMFEQQSGGAEHVKWDSESGEQLKQELKGLISLIIQNTARGKLEANWKNDYVVYATYKLMGEEAAAQQKLCELIDRLSENSKLYEPMGIQPGSKYPKFKEALNACLTALNSEMASDASMDVTRFRSLLADRYIASQKKLEIIGKLDASALTRHIKNEIEGIELSMDDNIFSPDELILKLPVSWIIQMPKIKLEATGSKKLPDVELYDMEFTQLDESFALIKFKASQWEDFYEDGDKIEFHLYYPSIDHPVALIFDVKVDKTLPSEIRFGKAGGYTFKKPLYQKKVWLK